MTSIQKHSALCALLLAGIAGLTWPSPPLAQENASGITRQNGVTLNLKDADIRSLIATVSEVTGKNFIVDPRVNAKVTVISSEPMSEDEIYQVFLSILQVHGFAAVPVGNVIKILPDVTAKQGPVAVTGPEHPGIGDQLVTRVIPVQHVPAAQLVPILRPLVPQQGHLAAYTASNVLVISDHAANVQRMVDIIERVDQPSVEEIEVIPLQHTSALEIVETITSLQQQQGEAGVRLPGDPVLAADERTNSILVSGSEADRLRIRALVARLDTPLETGGTTQVVFLNYADAEELAPILLGIAEEGQFDVSPSPLGTAPGAAPPAAPPTARRPVGAEGENEAISIVADPRTNSLIISGRPAEIQSVKSVIKQLDIRRAQVLVEAIIAEVSTDLSRDLGVQFFVDGTDSSGTTPAAITNFGGAGNSILQIIQNPFSVGPGLSLAVGDLMGGTNFGILLRALAGDAATNILSTPTLVTLDNQEAEIVVAQEVPFVTGQFTTPVSGGADVGAVSPFQTIEREDVGLILRITPQINEGGTIKLEIEQEASSLAASSFGASDLVVNAREIRTTVLVDNGQVLVLGGLIADSFTDRVQKVPLLGDLPLLGPLFTFTSTQKTKQNLMVFIHPVIIRDPVTADAYTQRKYDHLRERQREANISDRGLIEDSAAELPDLDDLITQIPVGAGTPSTEPLEWRVR